MIPYSPDKPATVIAYNYGRFIGQRYGRWNDLGQIREMVLREKWMAPGEVSAYDVVQDHGYLMRMAVDEPGNPFQSHPYGIPYPIEIPNT